MPVTVGCQQCCNNRQCLCSPCRNRGIFNPLGGGVAASVRTTAAGFTGSCAQFNGQHLLVSGGSTFCFWVTTSGPNITFQIRSGNIFLGLPARMEAAFTVSPGAVATYRLNLQTSHDDCNTPAILPLFSNTGCVSPPATIQIDFLPLITCCPNIIAPDTVRFTIVDPAHRSCLDGLSAVAPFLDQGDVSGHEGLYEADFTTGAGCFLCPPFFFQNFSLYLKCGCFADSNWCLDYGTGFANSYTASLVSCSPFMLTFTGIPVCNGDLVNVVITPA